MQTVFALVLLPFMGTPSAEMYEFREIAVGGAVAVEVASINTNGQAVGGCAFRSGEIRPFIWQDQRGAILLEALGAEIASAAGINEHGAVTGYSLTPDGGQHAVLWPAAGGVVDLGALLGAPTRGRAINASGLVVCDALVRPEAENPDARHIAALYEPGLGFRSLGDLGGGYASPTDMNDAGTVVGYSVDAAGATRAFRWTAETGMQSLGDFGTESRAWGINDAGQIAGSYRDAEGIETAFLWDPESGFSPLQTPAGFASLAEDVGAEGQVIGAIVPLVTAVGEPLQRGVAWQPPAGLFELRTAISGETARQVNVPKDITPRGAIVGFNLKDDASGASAGSFVLLPRPARPVIYVSGQGDDISGLGTSAEPYRTVAAAMTAAAGFASVDTPAEIMLAEGVYREAVTLRPYVHMRGLDPDDPASVRISHYDPSGTWNAVVTAAEGTRLENLTLSFPEVPGDVATLLDVAGVTAEAKNVVFDGQFGPYTIGLMIQGDASSASVIEDCVFTRMRDGVWAVDSGVTITRCSFDWILHDAIFVRRPVAKQGDAAPTPQLGDAGALGKTAFNRFRGVDGKFIRNANPAQTSAEFNDWGVDTVEEIAEKVQGAVDFEPYVGKRIGPGTVVVRLLDGGQPVAVEAQPSCTLSGSPGAFDEPSLAFVFSGVASGSHTVWADAKGYAPASTQVDVEGGAIVPVEIGMTASGEPLGCGASGKTVYAACALTVLGIGRRIRRTRRQNGRLLFLHGKVEGDA